MRQPFLDPQGGFSIELQPDAGPAVITMAGRVTGPRLIAALEALVELAEYRPERGRLWDLRDADMSTLTRGEFRALSSRIRALELLAETSRVATVVSREVDFGVMRMYELTEGDDLPGTIRVFRDYHKAESWLTG